MDADNERNGHDINEVKFNFCCIVYIYFSHNGPDIYFDNIEKKIWNGWRLNL